MNFVQITEYDWLQHKGLFFENIFKNLLRNRKGDEAETLHIKFKMSSFKSNENIHKKEDGPYYVVSANKASTVTL